jgi:mRNA interferase MazF
MVTVVRGDVILCDLNPVVGTEQAGVQPALIIQIDRANTVSPHTIIAPFTTGIRRAGIGGLTHDSVVL